MPFSFSHPKDTAMRDVTILFHSIQRPSQS